MTSATDFIAELIRAANQVEKLSVFEKRRLLERSVRTIREMRLQTGIASRRPGADPVVDLQTAAVALTLGKRTNDEVRDALLDAANMIRTLKIMLDAK